MRQDQIIAILALLFILPGLIFDIFNISKAPLFVAIGAVLLAISAIQYTDYRFWSFIKKLEDAIKEIEDRTKELKEQEKKAKK